MINFIVSKRLFSTQTPIMSFRQLRLLDEIWGVLDQHKITSPTPIQTQAIPELLKGKSSLLTAQTGTGKTLAYATPLMHMLKMQELKAGIRLTVPHRPRSIVVVPNRELATQVEEVFRMFMYDVPLKFYAAYPGTKLKTEFMKIEQGIDLLITTPDRLVRHQNARKIFLSNCSSLVIDEWDTLLDAGMDDFIRNLVNPMIKNNKSKEMQYVHNKKVKHSNDRQVIFCAATVTKHIENIVSNYWIPGDKSFKHLIEKNTHMNLANLDHEFIKLSEKDKYGPLRLILKEFSAFINISKTAGIIFWNSVQSARSAEHTVRSFGFKVSSLHGDIPPRMRKKYLDDFKARRTDILIATDLGSRGLDFPFVSHIYNLDFPKTISDYLHRAGRAGRAGRVGYVKSFYRTRDEKIIEEMRRSHEESVPMHIKGSAYTLRKTHERPVGAVKTKPLPVSRPGKRKAMGDPLQADSSLLIKSYQATPTKKKTAPKRVLNYVRQSPTVHKSKKVSEVIQKRRNKKKQSYVGKYRVKQNKRFIDKRR